jgi:hemerythrin
MHIAWNQALELGIPDIDAEHRMLLARLGAVMESRTAEPLPLSGTLEALRDLTRRRFAAEERWMRKHRYPRFAEHKAKHDAFLEALRHHLEARTSVAGSEQKAALDRWIASWFDEHVREEDLALGHYRIARRMGPPVDRLH